MLSVIVKTETLGRINRLKEWMPAKHAPERAKLGCITASQHLEWIQRGRGRCFHPLELQHWFEVSYCWGFPSLHCAWLQKLAYMEGGFFGTLKLPLLFFTYS